MRLPYPSLPLLLLLLLPRLCVLPPGVPPRQLYRMNPMLKSDAASEVVLSPGQTILVPGAKYSVRDGEILAGLAVGVGKVLRARIRLDVYAQHALPPDARTLTPRCILALAFSNLFDNARLLGSPCRAACARTRHVPARRLRQWRQCVASL